MQAYILWTFLLCAFINNSNARSVVVETTYGKVRGETKVVSGGTTIVSFQGIPYAAPPVGDLRFKRPQKPQSWQGTRDATKQPKECMQDKVSEFLSPLYQPSEQSEDCLYLNVWKPEVVSSPLPVIVWIISEAFMYGNTNTQNFDTLVAGKNVTVVSLNFRTGVFGYLYLGLDQSEAPGNMGLLDELEALKWVKENIKKFGGDPNSVTILGYGGLHTVSPLSKGYVNRNIAIGPTKYENSPVLALHYAKKLTAAIKCDEDSIDKTAQCLRNKPAATLLNEQSNILKNAPFLVFPFGPVIDGYFLPDTGANLARQGTNNVTRILGTGTGFASWMLTAFIPKIFTRSKAPNLTTEQFQTALQTVLRNPPPSSSISSNADLIYNFMASPQTTYLTKIKEIVQDKYRSLYVFDRGSNLEGLGYPTYCFEFDYRSSNISEQGYHEWNDAIGIVLYVIGYPIQVPPEMPILKPVFTKDPAKDKKVAQMFMDYLVNFATNGDPNGVGLPTWPRCKSNKYLNFNRSGDVEAKILPEKAEKRLQFWNQFIPNMEAQYCKESGRADELICMKREYKLQPKKKEKEDDDGKKGGSRDYVNIIIIVVVCLCVVIAAIIIGVTAWRARTKNKTVA